MIVILVHEYNITLGFSEVKVGEKRPYVLGHLVLLTSIVNP
jgi:hypothetical protein